MSDGADRNLLATRATGLKSRHVPYSGGGPCISAVAVKHVDFWLAASPNNPSTGKGRKIESAGGYRLKAA